MDSDYFYVLAEVGIGVSLLAAAAAFIVSIIMFIKDGIKAKKENRERKPTITAFFLIMVCLAATFLSFFLLIYYLACTTMLGM
jgi:O-antigen/teichoic acid export membrane protein